MNKYMAQEVKLWTKEDMIEQIKKCGQGIIDNASDLASDAKYLMEVKIEFTVGRKDDNMPTINVSRKFIPEGIVETIDKQEEN